MAITILGPGLDEAVRTVTAGGAWPATLFLDGPVLVTTEPPVHGLQRAAYLESVNQKRVARGDPPLTEEQEATFCRRSVDLFLKPNTVQIRPDPGHMDLAFEADDLLEELFTKPHRRFLNVDQLQVQQAIKERGELWRISTLPSTKPEIARHIADAKARISEEAIYYYNLYNGTRFVTYAEFARLNRLEASALARQLDELAVYATRLNRLKHPEVDFFMAQGRFGAAQFAGLAFRDLKPADVLAQYERLRASFLAAVPPEFQRDEPELDLWRTEMYSALVSQRDDTEAEIVLAGLNLEFKQRIRWLPCGRFEQGELMIDEVFEAARREPEDPSYRGLCDENVKDIVFNLVREYGLLDWANVGRILPSPNSNPARVTNVHASEGGRRDVYVAQVKRFGADQVLTRFMRMQKYGVRERLDEGKDLLRAMLETEGYIEYILDRRLGCWYLGVHVPLCLTMRRLQEAYHGKNPEYHDWLLPVTYFEREFIPGFPANQLPRSRYEQPGFALGFARLLGAAAAANLIVGRGNSISNQVVFDVGDEIVVEDEAGLPKELIVGDHAGSFVCFRETLIDLAPAYAKPVNDRVDKVPEPAAFGVEYLAGFETRFREIQAHYRSHRRAYNALFKRVPPDPNGNFSYRWECVLRRLDEADPAALAHSVRLHIAVLPRNPAG